MSRSLSRSRVLLAGLVVAGSLMTAALPAMAKDGDVIRTGACSNRSDWKLKLSPEDGAIEVELEVDTPRVGQTWRIRMKQNGVLFWTGTRTTTSPSGAFHVRKVRPDTAGTDSFRARSVNLVTGEVCVATASM